jgi:hypothetical protein
MQHRITLSKDLLIVLAANKRRRRQGAEFIPKVKGIKIDKQVEVKVKPSKVTSETPVEAEALYA